MKITGMQTVSSFDEICVKTVADAKTAVAMWEQGEVDITVVPLLK